MVMAKVNQHFGTLNTAQDSLLLPSTVMSEIFTMKKGLPEGFDFVLFSPEGKPVNTFGMAPLFKKKPVVLFNEVPDDPASIFFYHPDKLEIPDVVVKVVEDNFETMLGKFNVKNVVKSHKDPWWLFMWL